MSQNIPKCPKMSQNVHFRRIVVRTDSFYAGKNFLGLKKLFAVKDVSNAASDVFNDVLTRFLKAVKDNSIW